MQSSRKPVTPEQACLKMADLCSRSEQCEADISKKLIRMGLNPLQRKEVMEYLKEERYIDNRRYACCFARDKARFSSWGPLKIKASLIAHHISANDIREALESVDPEIWEDGLMKSALSKSRNLNLSGQDGREDRIKLYRFLLGRGFRSAEAVKAVRKMRDNQTNEDEE